MTEKMTIKTIEEYIADYTPLVRATAVRYTGRGAEIEDLVQEGYLALIVLIPKCPDVSYLAGYLKNNLPGYVRDAAERLRCTRGSADGEVLLEDIEEIVGEEESLHKYSEAELRAMLDRALTADELDLTQALIEGFSQSEIARTLGISQQAVTKRLRKVRDKLKGVIEAL